MKHLLTGLGPAESKKQPRWCLHDARIILAALVSILSVSACTTRSLSDSVLIGENDQFAIVIASEGESYQRLAAAFYRDADLDWRIEDANGGQRIRAGEEVIIPKTSTNRTGVWADGYQTLPILSYHRFGENKGRLAVTQAQFEAQMAFLQQNGFTVVSFDDATAFFRGEKPLPRKSVVLTIDDGYQSVYHIAYPILRRYGFPATVFIYSDYIGRGGLTWKQMQEMEASGLIEFQAHSQTHVDLTKKRPEESLEDYKRRLASEVKTPGRVIGKKMDRAVTRYAYPYGAVNRPVVDELKRAGYAWGATVKRGGNPFFAYPYALRRTMIYRSDTLDDFASALQTFVAR